MKLKPALALALTATTLFTLVPHVPARAPLTQDEGKVGDDQKPGLRFRLSDEKSKDKRPARNKVAEAARLSDEETKRLLARLPPIKEDEADAQSFRLRESSLPVPRAGKTIQAAFAQPPTGGRPAPSRTDASLEVLRFAPEGDVELAPALSVTFSQPMVAVSSQE